jgi:HlyD family secretion protein
MKKRRTPIIVVIGLLLAAVGGYVAYGRLSSPTALGDEPLEPTLETATVMQGDIVITADGSGEIVPAAELELAFRTNGVLAEVMVEVGDVVEEGDVVARLETDELERAVAEADVDVQLAQLDLADVQDGPDEAELADAEAALRDAEAELVLAQDAYAETLDSNLDTAVERQKAQYDWYVSNYQKNKAAFEAGNLSQSDHDYAMNAMMRAEGQWKTAVNEAATERIQAANRTDQARSAVNQAQEALELLESEPLTDTLIRAELEVDQALMAREQALANLEAAQLYAPFSGTVMEIAATAGEQVEVDVDSRTPILVLADLEEPLLCFWVEESDMSSVVVGNRVSIVFEAFPDDVFSGEIVNVEPVLVTVDNTSAVQAWASIDLGVRHVSLLSGMSAEVEVIAAETRGALLVPVEALRETSPGQYAVFVVRPDGELEMRAVVVGLSDPVNAEVLTGLEPGDVVSLGGANQR